MKKYVTAFVMGLGSFLIFWGAGEYLSSLEVNSGLAIAAGVCVLAGLLGGYAYCCLWLLARGDGRGVRQQWPLLLSFNFILTAFALAVPVLVHKWLPAFSMFCLAGYSWFAACAGVARAAKAARRQAEAND